MRDPNGYFHSPDPYEDSLLDQPMQPTKHRQGYHGGEDLDGIIIEHYGEDTLRKMAQAMYAELRKHPSDSECECPVLAALTVLEEEETR